MGRAMPRYTGPPTQYDCSNCDVEEECSGDKCHYEMCLLPISDDELRAVNTMRLIEGKSPVGMSQLKPGTA